MSQSTTAPVQLQSQDGGAVFDEVEDGVRVRAGSAFPYVAQEIRLASANRAYRITLRTEGDRRRIVYDLYEEPGGRVEKRTIPKHELPGREGEASRTGRIPVAAMIWAEEKLSDFVEERRRAVEVAAQAPRLASGRPATTSLALVQQEILRSAYLANLTKNSRSARIRALRILIAVLGGDFAVEHFDDNEMGRVISAYKEGITIPNNRGGRQRVRAKKQNTLRNLYAETRSILTACQKIRHPDAPEHTLVDEDRHPFKRVTKVAAGATKPALAREVEFPILYRHSDAVEYGEEAGISGAAAFRVIFSDARWTSHRVGAIRQMRRNWILYTVDEIANALRSSLSVYWRDEGEMMEIARYYAGRFGAVYRPWFTQKQGSREDPKVAQYDRVVPMGPFQRAETDIYLETTWNKLNLPLDGPLFPCADDLTMPIYGDQLEKWYEAVVEAAIAAGEDVRRVEGVRWKGWRTYRRNEPKRQVWRVHDKDIAFTGGWSINSFPDAKAQTAMNTHYLGIEAQELAYCVESGFGNEITAEHRKILGERPYMNVTRLPEMDEKRWRRERKKR